MGLTNRIGDIMYLKVEDTLVSFKIEGPKLICYKFINGTKYKLIFDTPKLSEKLFNMLDRINSLDDEFWKPLALA